MFYRQLQGERTHAHATRAEGPDTPSPPGGRGSLRGDLLQWAVYLGGYAVEAALKARICRLLGAENYPDSGKYKGVYAVHDLDQLLFLAGLQGKPELQKAPLFESWTLAAPWKPDLRYSPPGTITRKQAAEILKTIRDPRNGVLRWIKSYW